MRCKAKNGKIALLNATGRAIFNIFYQQEAFCRCKIAKSCRRFCEKMCECAGKN